MYFNIIFYGLLIITILFLWQRRKFYILSWKIGGPLGYPLLGIGYEFLNQENILTFVLKVRNEYGPIFFSYLGLTPVLVVSEPVAAEKILTSTAFVNKSFIYNAVKVALGDGLFTAEYLKWSQHRKLLNPTFNHKVLLTFYPVFNKQVKILNEKLKTLVGKGSFDLLLIIQNCALDISCQTTMGKEMNFQSGDNLDIVHGYEDLLKYATKRIFIPWYVSDFLFSFFPDKKPFYNAVNTTQTFVGKLVKIKMNRYNSKINHSDGSTSSYTDDEFNITKPKNIFVDQVLKLMFSNSFTEKDVRDQSNTVVTASFETTAKVVHNTLLCLAMFPEYQERVFDEIISIFPDKDIEITYEDTQQMVYLEMVINETMRLLSPVPLIARKCTEDFDFGNGIIIPKGTQIAIDIFHMQRCEKIWGPKANTFYPDHFLKDNFSNMHPYAFIPFSKGMRNCIGWRYGMMSLKVFLAQILRSYRLATNFKFEDLKYVEDITLKFIETPKLEIFLRDK